MKIDKDLFVWCLVLAGWALVTGIMIVHAIKLSSIVLYALAPVLSPYLWLVPVYFLVVSLIYYVLWSDEQ